MTEKSDIILEGGKGGEGEWGQNMNKQEQKLGVMITFHHL